MTKPPGLTLNSGPFPFPPPYPGPLATARQRKAYEQYKAELAKRPPPAPLKPIEPLPDLFDVIREGFDNSYRAGQEKGRKEEQEANKTAPGGMPGVVEEDAILFGQHRNSGLNAKKARKEVINALFERGVHLKTAENRATNAKNYWEHNLALK
jgi:hypothetical protein